MDVLKSRSEIAEENIKNFCFQQCDQPILKKMHGKNTHLHALLGLQKAGLAENKGMSLPK